MTIVFRVEMVIVAIAFAIFVIRAINKNIFLPKNGFSWLIISAVLILFAIFPDLPINISHFFGFETTANFLYFCAVFILLLYTISMTINYSKQQNKIVKLIQEVSLLKKEHEEE